MVAVGGRGAGPCVKIDGVRKSTQKEERDSDEEEPGARIERRKVFGGRSTRVL